MARILRKLESYGFNVKASEADLKDRRMYRISSPVMFKSFLNTPDTPVDAVRQFVRDLQVIIFNIENGYESYGLEQNSRRVL